MTCTVNAGWEKESVVQRYLTLMKRLLLLSSLSASLDQRAAHGTDDTIRTDGARLAAVVAALMDH
jgi:hypothetical protein